MSIHNFHSLPGVSNKGTSQPHKNHISTPSRSHPCTTNNSTNKHQMNNKQNHHNNHNNHNNNNNHTNEISTKDDSSAGVVESARQHLVTARKDAHSVCNSIRTSTNNRDQSITTMVGTKETVSFSKEATETKTIRKRVRKTSHKKHPLRKERRREREQQKEMNRLDDRMAMAMNGYNDIGGGHNEEESSIVEEYELVSDQVQLEREFQAAGQEEDIDINNKYSDPGTDEDIPTMVGRKKDDASSDGSSGNGSYAVHTDNNNSSVKDSDDDFSIMPGQQERCRDDSSSDNSMSAREENGQSPTATQIPHSIDTRPIIPP